MFSHLHFLVSDDVSKENVLNTIVNTEFVIIVNVGSNLSTVVRRGVVIDQWHSVTGDITGEFHKISEDTAVPKRTPYGVYSFDEIQHCPVWYPRAIRDPAAEEVEEEGAEESQEYAFLTTTDSGYWEVVAENPHIYGPCGSENPLGEYVMWFHADYGYHGTSTEARWILGLDEAVYRRVSGGCIRNPPEKILKLFDMFLSLPKLGEFQGKVHKNRMVHEAYVQAKADGSAFPAPETLTFKAADIDAKLIVGNFKGDLPVKEDAFGIKTVKLQRQQSCEVITDHATVYQGHDMKVVSDLRRRGDRILPLAGNSHFHLIRVANGWMEASSIGACEVKHVWVPHFLKKS